MKAELLDRNTLAFRWQANERELSRIGAMPGLDRELHGALRRAVGVSRGS
jgi:hypothetical protein